MLHSRFSRLATILLASATIFSSCQKDLDVQSADIDQLRVRGANGGNLSSLAAVGRQVFFDNKLSNPVGSQACASCHMPNVGFAGLGDGPGFVQGIGQGAVVGAFGGRKPPSAAYATFAPQMTLATPPADPADPAPPVPEFTGGLFWDGRATGLRLGNPAAEQALGPFLADAEHNVANKETILNTIKSSNYYNLWLAAFNNEPIDVSTPALIDANYDKVGRAIAAYEATSEVNKFTSKFDAYMKGQTRLSPAEARGLALFNLDAECYDCHASVSHDGITPALFTDFSYHNLGLPKNMATPNKSRLLDQDLGLGGELETVLPNGQFKYPATWRAQAVAQYGKFKTPTLRNVAGPNRRYMHNGIFNSLEAVVHFYNTRDVAGAGWTFDGVFKTWAELGKEVNLNIEIHGAGNLGLTPAQEADLVAFMKTLSDGWNPSANVNTVL
ncbi:MAG: methylamine metabolism protein [Bacteroidota bacterium]